MSDPPSEADGQSLNIDQLVADFKARTKPGEQFSFEKLLEAHPEHTAELTRYFQQWKESETPTQSDKAETDTSSTETSAPDKISFEDATAHTMIQGTGDSESSLTRDFQQPNTEATSEIEISNSFSRYEIQKVLGQGAMGAVYLAKDTQLDRDVALKIPKFGDGNGVDEEELLARFYREARAAATLRSPNICPVYDVGEIDGQHYITMAFIDGRPLKDYTKSKKTHSEKQIITTIRKLALGLSEAHEIGVIHRDLKPANIMIDRKGEPVVMDFGLARRSSSDDVQVTQSGAIIGTPAYMAPEQVAGDQAVIDHQVDIYALGVIMYELITGEMPFKGNLMALLQQIALNNPTKPSQLRPDIDPRLEAICLKMIAGDREQRYQSMTDVANDLQEVLRNPDERHKQAQAKKKGQKPKSLPTAKEESNPALISIDRSKSSAERMRDRRGKSAKKTRSSGPSKKLLIAGGIGGLLLLLGMVYFVRDGKQDVQITQDDPGITNRIAGKTALTAKVVNGQRDGLLNGELPNSHSASESLKNPPPAASNSQRYALTFPEPTSVVEVKAPFRLDEDFTLEAWVSEGDISPTANGEAPPNETILDLSIQMMLNLVHDQRLNKWSFVTATKLIPGYEYVICRGSYTNNNIAIRGERNHIATIFENGEVRLYVDGKRLDKVNYGPEQTPAQSKPPTMVRELLIGNTRMAGQSPFRGLIEGVRYSKGARYNEDFMPPAELTNDSNTEALYLFKEGQGDILKDYSGNGYDGKIIDAKWVKVGSETTISSPPPLAVAPFDEQQAKAHQQAWAEYLGIPVEQEVELPGGEKMSFMLIPPGEFMMGSTEEEQSRFLEMAKSVDDDIAIKRISDEGPRHRVRITSPYYLGKYEVTQAQWKSVMGNDPSQNKDNPSHPVEQVSWSDVQACLETLNKNNLTETLNFELPSEAQWEYACRAGTTTAFSFGDDPLKLPDYGWKRNSSNGETHPVGALKPNAYGLYDMHGNVWEMCADLYPKDQHHYTNASVSDPTGSSAGWITMMRGGCHYTESIRCRSAHRGQNPRESQLPTTGFRLALKINKTQKAPPEKSAGELTGNYALEFDGKSSIVHLPEMEYDFLKPFTIEVLARPSNFLPDGSRIGYLLKGTNSFGILQYKRYEDDLWSFSLPGGAGDGNLTQYSNSDEPILQNKLVHIAGIWDGKKNHLYVNGKKQQESNEITDLVSIPARFWLGGRWSDASSGSTNHYCGTLDEIRISSIVRHTEDYSPTDRFEPDVHTLALYHFDEGDGDVLIDSSGNGYDGKIIGAKWVRVKNNSAEKPLAEMLTSDEYEWTEPVNLGPNVNSGENDVYPTLPADGLSLIFSSKRGKHANLYECRRASIDDDWGPAQELIGINLSQHDQITPWLSADGLTLLFGNKSPGGKNINLFQTRRATRDTPWDTPIDLGSSINSDKEDGGGALSPDGLTMYLASKRPGSRFRDLYRTQRPALDAPWQEPKLLGREINLAWEEKCPQLLPDGISLMYLGGKKNDYQLMLAQPVADGKYEVQALESPVNNISFCLSADGQTIIFDSRRPDGLGGLDLWMTRRVKKTADAPPPAVAPFDEKQANAHQKAWADYLGEPVMTSNSVGMQLVVIPPGNFKFGEAGEAVPVTLTKPFRIGIHEVTQGQWKEIMGTEPWKGQEKVQLGDTLPATYVSWIDVTEFCRKLSKREQTTDRLASDWEYRLPTQAEWEYACRAGTTTEYSFGNDASQLEEYGWAQDWARIPGKDYPRGVGLKKSNPWGLYDVHGNVWEWCSDRHIGLPRGTDPQGPEDGIKRIVRGGSWTNDAETLKSAYRFSREPSSGSYGLGFRVVRTINTAQDEQVDKSSSQTIDLLADLVPTNWNSENMSWQMQDGILAGNSSASRKKKDWVGATFPQEIDGDYDLELELKNSGFSPLQIDLPLGNMRAIRLHLGGLGSALMQIDGKGDRDAAPQYRNQDATLKRNVWQLLTAKVRHHGENVSIDVALDGVRIGQFSGPRSRITLPKRIKPDPVHVKFAGTGTSSTLELEFRQAIAHINPPAAMQIDQTSPK
ncbi:MAG: SUMF1/EgtB/PvdO family nonheme iron enzyme [Gimesia chilikensis]|uniref:SUMF1/EgtB/PvdO family nonheme iron enzyme n=1 Tax=Gimesia chilikensis TaxID=2605989 RepID=UPI003789F379